MYLIGGDTLLRMLVFWSIFVPLSRAWSVDQWRKRRQQIKPHHKQTDMHSICSVGTGCLLLQVCVMYVTAGLSKWNEPWLNGIAMDYIFRQDCYARPLSGWLVQFPTFTAMVTYATLVIELCFPLLVFLPFRIPQLRIAAVAFFLAFHAGIEMTMDVGKFTYVSIVAWLLFLPPMFWDRFRRTKLKESPSGQISTEPIARLGRLTTWGRNCGSVALPLTLFVYVLFWNVAGLYGEPRNTWLNRNPGLLYRFGNITMLRQNFHMFCIPARVNTTFLCNGRTASGDRVDLVRRIPASDVGPGSALPVAPEWKTLHWYLISFEGEPALYEALLEYHASCWNQTAGAQQRVHEARLERFDEDIGPGVIPGSFVHTPNVAQWKAPNLDEIPETRLKQDFERTMDLMESGGLFPTDYK